MCGATQGGLPCKYWGLSPRLDVVSAPGLTIPAVDQLQLAGILQLLPHHNTVQCFRVIS